MIYESEQLTAKYEDMLLYSSVYSIYASLASKYLIVSLPFLKDRSFIDAEMLDVLAASIDNELGQDTVNSYVEDCKILISKYPMFFSNKKETKGVSSGQDLLNAIKKMAIFDTFAQSENDINSAKKILEKPETKTFEDSILFENIIDSPTIYTFVDIKNADVAELPFDKTLSKFGNISVIPNNPQDFTFGIYGVHTSYFTSNNVKNVHSLPFFVEKYIKFDVDSEEASKLTKDYGDFLANKNDINLRGVVNFSYFSQLIDEHLKNYGSLKVFKNVTTGLRLMYNRSTDYGDLINGIKTTTKDKKTQLAPSIIESKSQYLVEGLAPKMYIPLASAEIIHAGVPTGNVKAILDDDLGKLISNLKESQEYNFIFGYLFPMQKIVAMENVYLLERFIEIYNLVKQRNQVLKTIDDNFEKTSGLLHTNSSDGKKY